MDTSFWGLWGCDRYTVCPELIVSLKIAIQGRVPISCGTSCASKNSVFCYQCAKMKGQNTIHYQNKSAINLIGCQVSDMARSMKCKNSKKDFTFSSYICKYIVLSDSNSRLWQATMKIIRTILFLSMIIFLFFASESKSLNAIEEPAKGIMARPDEPCRTNPIASWTPQEKWVWEQVCVGKIADLGIIKAVVGTLTQKETKEWSEKSVLRPAFLETILLHEPYRGAITRHGVRIVGAWFKETLDLFPTH